MHRRDLQIPVNCDPLGRIGMLPKLRAEAEEAEHLIEPARRRR